MILYSGVKSCKFRMNKAQLWQIWLYCFKTSWLFSGKVTLDPNSLVLILAHINSLGINESVIICLSNLFIADVSTDGKWCYLVFWVVGKPTTRWYLLRERLLEACPPCTLSLSEIYYFRPEFQQPKPPAVFLLKFWCTFDRKGLLHGTSYFVTKFYLVPTY